MIDPQNILLTLAWLGEVSTIQIQRLYLPNHGAGRSDACIALLNALAGAGLLTRRWWSLPRVRAPHERGRIPPVRQSALWSLTDAGRTLVAGVDEHPLRLPACADRYCLPVTTQTTEVVVQLVAHIRRLSTDLRTISVVHHAPILRAPPRPALSATADALVTVSIMPTRSASTALPWTRDTVRGTAAAFALAVHSDRAHLSASTITRRAEAHRRAARQGVHERNDLPLTPLWVVPTPDRLHVIHHLWCDQWPDGTWLLATDADLAANRAVWYQAGQLAATDLFPVSLVSKEVMYDQCIA